MLTVGLCFYFFLHDVGVQYIVPHTFLRYMMHIYIYIYFIGATNADFWLTVI